MQLYHLAAAEESLTLSGSGIEPYLINTISPVLAQFSRKPDHHKEVVQHRIKLGWSFQGQRV